MKARFHAACGRIRPAWLWRRLPLARASFIALSLLLAVLSIASRAQTLLEDRVVRLSPAAFPSLPAQVRIGLARLGCSVPQTSVTRSPENVIRGQFTRSSAHEWAVLCSVGGQSEILVFTSHSPIPVSRFAKAPDSIFTQVVEPGRTGFSRRISAVPGRTPGHTAIDDAFLEKASTVWRWQAGRWQASAGAD